jgi:hypothetical protein
MNIGRDRLYLRTAVSCNYTQADTFAVKSWAYIFCNFEQGSGEEILPQPEGSLEQPNLAT